MQDLLTSLNPNVIDKLPAFYEEIGDTLLMVAWSGTISLLLGLFLVMVTVTKTGGLLPRQSQNRLRRS